MGAFVAPGAMQRTLLASNRCSSGLTLATPRTAHRGMMGNLGLGHRSGRQCGIVAAAGQKEPQKGENNGDDSDVKPRTELSILLPLIVQ